MPQRRQTVYSARRDVVHRGARSRFLVLLPWLLLPLAAATGACGTSSGFSAQEQQYLRDIDRGASWPTSSNAQKTLVRDGEATCNALTRGVSFSDAESVLIDSHLTVKHASAMLVASAVDLCPQFASQLETWIQQQKSG